MKKSKHIEFSVMNVFTAIGVATVLLGSAMLFFSLAVVRDENGQYALSLFSGGSPKTAQAPALTKTIPKSKILARSPSVDTGESACGFIEEWQIGSSAETSVAYNNGKIYFVDGLSDVIRVLDPKTGKTIVIGKRGLGQGEFIHPNDIAFDQYSNMYISELGQNGAGRLQMLDKDGKWKKEWTAKDIPGGGAFLPTKLAYYHIRDNPQVSFDMEYVAVVNSANNTILRLDLYNATLQSFTSYSISGKIIGMDTTEYIDIYTQYMFISTEANKILKFNLYGGVYAGEWSAGGGEKFGDVAVYGYGDIEHLYVVDTLKNIIHEYDFKGNETSPFGGLYDGVNKYVDIISLFYGEDGFIYATTKSGKVIKFGNDCATLNVHKDVLPGNSDFIFNFTLRPNPSSSKTTRVSHFSTDFSLADQSPKGSTPSTIKIKVPKGLGVDPYDPNQFLITEAKSPNLEAYWQCDYGSGNGKFPEDFPAKGNVAWVNVAKGTVETDCYFYNTNNPFAKLSISKYTPSEKNYDEFDFTIDPAISYQDPFSIYDGNAYSGQPEHPSNTNDIIISAGTKYTITEQPVKNKKFNVSYECYYQNKDYTRTLYKKGDGNVADITANEGENINCVFSNRLIPKDKIGTIIIKKDAIPDSKDDQFYFQGIVSPWFFVKDDGTGNNSHKVDQIDEDLQYTIQESVYPYNRNYYTNISCKDSKGRNVESDKKEGYYGTSKVTVKFIDPKTPDTITCNYTNYLGGKITVIKSVNLPPEQVDLNHFNFNLKGGLVPFATSFDFTLDDDKYEGNPYNTEKDFTVPPGGFILQEKDSTDYTTATTCVDQNGKKVAVGTKITAFNIKGGDNITCTVVNTKKTGSTTPNGTTTGSGTRTSGTP